jgi:hypothetical protein
LTIGELVDMFMDHAERFFVHPGIPHGTHDLVTNWCIGQNFTIA